MEKITTTDLIAFSAIITSATCVQEKTVTVGGAPEEAVQYIFRECSTCLP
jgi:hypothetical protein